MSELHIVSVESFEHIYRKNEKKANNIQSVHEGL